MCGISGITGKIFNKERFILYSKKFLKNRGPDNFSFVNKIESKSLICHSRLSLIDIKKRSNQPFFSKCGNYVLTYNGELYNYRDLRNELIDYGFIFKTESDTEVFLYGLIHFGIEKFLSEKVEGMYAFAFYDLRNNNLWLSRDPYGQKPLSYFVDNSKFIFASDSRIISNYLNKNDINIHSIEGFLCFGFVPSNDGFYKDIFDIFPGFIYKYEMNYKKLKKFPVRKKDVNFLYGNENCYLDFKEKLINSVRDVYEADVDVGIFLSSGLDSSVIALISKYILNKDPFCFSIGSGLKKDENVDIKRFCKKNSLNSLIYSIDPYQAAEEFIKYPEIYDRPMSDTSCALISFLSKKVKNETRCVISGDGADELFWGYPRYKKYILLNKLNKFIICKNFLNHFAKGSYFWKILYENSIEGYFRISNATNGIVKYNKAHWNCNRVFEGDIYEYLPQNCLVKSDRASMFSSLEIRAPFLSKKMSTCSDEMNFETKSLISKNKLFHRKLYKELSGQEYEIKSKRGFSLNKSDIKKVLSTEFELNINRSIQFLSENGYEYSLMRKISKKKSINWRLFSLGLYLNQV